MVTLEGAVNLYIDLVNLEKKIKKIKNVDGVRNHVQVQSNVPDDQLRQSLADKLRYDRAGFGIAFNAIPTSRTAWSRSAAPCATIPAGIAPWPSPKQRPA